MVPGSMINFSLDIGDHATVVSSTQFETRNQGGLTVPHALLQPWYRSLMIIVRRECNLDLHGSETIHHLWKAIREEKSSLDKLWNDAWNGIITVSSSSSSSPPDSNVKQGIQNNVTSKLVNAR